MRIFKSLLGVVLSLILFWVISTLSYWALVLLESFRSWTWFHGGELFRTFSKILVGHHAYPSPQGFFNNLLATGVGAYLAIKGVDKLLKEYSRKIVFYGFSVSLILFTGYAIILMIPAAKDLGFGFYSFSIQILTPVVAIGTAFFTIGKK